jgi:hypothetical protein
VPRLRLETKVRPREILEGTTLSVGKSLSLGAPFHHTPRKHAHHRGGPVWPNIYFLWHNDSLSCRRCANGRSDEKAAPGTAQMVNRGTCKIREGAVMLSVHTREFSN